MSEAAKRVAIVGAGDLGKSLQRQLADIPDLRVVGFFDDTIESDPHVLGRIDDATKPECQSRYDELVMGIGYHHLRFRQSLFEKFRDAGITWATVIHPSATLAASANIGQGAIVSAGCVLDVGVTIGANTLLNVGCVIAHDSSVGPHTFFGPCVNVAGFVNIGQRCFLGIGTTIIDSRQLSDGCQTAAGSVITSDIGPSELVAGVPAVVKKTLES